VQVALSHVFSLLNHLVGKEPVTSGFEDNLHGSVFRSRPSKYVAQLKTETMKAVGFLVVSNEVKDWDTDAARG
jgi:hypothetical protein